MTNWLYQIVGFEFLVAHLENPHARSPGPHQLLVPKSSAHRPACKATLKGELWEPETHRNFARILTHKPGSVVHAGTFFGDMLHILSEYATMVYAFEPVLENFVFARINAQRLGLSNVQLHCCGLAKKSQVQRIQTTTRDGRSLGGLSRFQKQIPGDQLSELTAVIQIDQLKINDLSLLHLDVEGWELQALIGGLRTIHENKPIIMIEDNQSNCQRALSTMGYSHVFDVDDLSYYAVAEDLDFLRSLAP